MLTEDGIVEEGTHEELIKKALGLKRTGMLSNAALEVLAIISVNQPVTRAYVEQVRGVDCSAVIHSLVEKELIEEKGRMDAPGRPLLYGTTVNFLRVFNITSLADLPELAPMEEAAGEALQQQELPLQSE